jgi:hypothetical protein
MLASLLCLLSLAYGNAPIKRERESLQVKSPAVGDTIALAEPRCNELSLTQHDVDRTTSNCETTKLHFSRSRKQSLLPYFAERHNRYTAFLNLPNP